MTTVNNLVDFRAVTAYYAGMPRKEAQLGEVIDALANKQRRVILMCLAHGRRNTTDVGEQFGFTKQALSRHMAVLEQAGLIERTMVGRTHRLALLPAQLDRVARWLVELRRGWHASLDRLDHVLRSDKQ